MVGNEVIITDYDWLWKDLIQEFFQDFLLLLAPELHALVNLSKGSEFLKQELRQLFPDSELQGVRTGKLAKVFLKNGEEKWILIYIEVQGYAEKDFAERMFKYFYRAYDRYQRNIYAIAIFTDDRRHFKPEKYEYAFFKTELVYKYDTYKVIEQDEEELARSDNPFATAVLAGKYAIQSKHNRDLALTFKLRLARLLLEKKWSRERLEKLFVFISGSKVT